VAIGYEAGPQGAIQGANSIAIGYQAGNGQQDDNTIVINATGVQLPTVQIDSCYIAPIRNNTTNYVLYYDPQGAGNTFEVTYGDKTFIINHPVDQNRYLVHACLEGPEVGVYYRGESEITTGTKSITITLPDYVKAFAYDFTVQVTPIYNGTPILEQYQVSRVKDGSFTVYGQPGEFFWHVYGKRADINVEPLKSSVEVNGSGPYRWITPK